MVLIVNFINCQNCNYGSSFKFDIDIMSMLSKQCHFLLKGAVRVTFFLNI